MIAFPNAKINIGLRITEKRPDGYHNLETVMVPVGWYDILEIIPSVKTTLETTGHNVNCEPEKNLVVKALRKVEEACGKKLDVDIFLRKIIPDGAGLGGGSSDASFMIKLLNDSFRLNLSIDDMEDMASGIGSDCAMFIKNKPVYASGRGDILCDIDLSLKGWKIVIVKPSESVSTAQAYSSIVPKKPKEDLRDLLYRPVSEWKDSVFNDFEPVVFKYLPCLEEIKRELYQTGALYSSMSGSGSAMYGIYKPEHDNLADIEDFFKRKDLTVKVTEVLN